MKVAISWPPSTVHGWGIYALNLALQWSLDPEIEWLRWPHSEGMMLDPLRADRIMQLISQPVRYESPDIYLHALGNEFEPRRTSPIERTIGVIFFEKQLSAEAIARAKQYPLVITGSTWNERTLLDAGVSQVRTIFQGVDRSLFHPAPRLGLFGVRFAVFSGGKAEWRKGQDLVLDAFKVFSERRPDVVLVTAWQSRWPDLALEIGGVVTNGRVDVKAWAAKAGVDPDKVIDIGIVHQPMMPQILRECDCAVFPNRVEGGTNLVAMEAMACGLATYVSSATGHLDLEQPEWLDEHDEVLGALEEEYDERVGHNCDYDYLEGFHWSDTAAQLKAACKEIIGA